jgi:flagellar hook-associated protein 2
MVSISNPNPFKELMSTATLIPNNVVTTPTDITVVQVATCQSIVSQGYAVDATFTAGNQLQVLDDAGYISTQVTIDSTNNTIAMLATALNAVTTQGLWSVIASTVTDADGIHLVLTSTRTGMSGVINVTTVPTVDNSLDGLIVTTVGTETNGIQISNISTSPNANGNGTGPGWTQTSPGADGGISVLLYIGGSTNTFTNVIPGWTGSDIIIAP